MNQNQKYPTSPSHLFSVIFLLITARCNKALRTASWLVVAICPRCLTRRLFPSTSINIISCLSSQLFLNLLARDRLCCPQEVLPPDQCFVRLDRPSPFPLDAVCCAPPGWIWRGSWQRLSATGRARPLLITVGGHGARSVIAASVILRWWGQRAMGCRIPAGFVGEVYLIPGHSCWKSGWFLENRGLMAFMDCLDRRCAI